MRCRHERTQRQRKQSQRGQSLVEGALVLLVFVGLLFAVMDAGQVVLSHQSLVERTRAAVRWGTIHPWDGTGEQIANLILYDQPDAPRSTTQGYLGLTRANVSVIYRPPVADRPDDEMISVAIVNYQFRFFSPWITKTFIDPRPVAISAPMSLHADQSKTTAALAR